MVGYSTLPAELKYLIHEHCDARTLAALLQVDKVNNKVALKTLQRKLEQVQDDHRLKIGVYGVMQDPGEAHWYSTNYVKKSKPVCVAEFNLESVSESSSEDERDDQGINVEMSEDDEFVQVYVQVVYCFARRVNLTLMKSVQRVHKNLLTNDNKKGRMYMMNKKECSCRMTLERADDNEPERNRFGEFVQRYKVGVSELKMNSAFLFDKVQRSQPSALIVM